MSVPHIAYPTRTPGEPYEAAAARYGEAYADHEAAQDAAAGLPPACSAAARPARVAAATAAALRYWQRQQQEFDDLPVLAVTSR